MAVRIQIILLSTAVIARTYYMHNQGCWMLSEAVVNVCNLPTSKRQSLNTSCDFETSECTARFTSPMSNYWKLKNGSIGNMLAGDHSRNSSGTYYLFNAGNYFPRGDPHRDQLMLPLVLNNNICLRFWYNLVSVTSNLKVIVNGKTIFNQTHRITHGWVQKYFFITYRAPVQIVFESTKLNTFSYVGIDDVIVEIDRYASTSTLSTTTILTTLTNAPSITNSTKTAVHSSTTSSVTTSTLSETTNPTTTANVSTTTTTPVTRQTAKTFTMALNTKSTTTATQNVISTRRATFTPTTTSTSSTSKTTKSVRTTETPMKTSATSATATPTSIKRTSTTTQSTTFTTTATTTRFKSSTQTTAGTFTKPSTTGTVTTLTILTSTPTNTKRAKSTTSPTKTPPSITEDSPKLTTMPTISNTLINTHPMPTTPRIISTNIFAPSTIYKTFEPPSAFQDIHTSIFLLFSTTNSFCKINVHFCKDTNNNIN